MQSFVNRDFVNHIMSYESDDGLIVIVSSCYGVVRPVARHCDRTILTQFISIVTTNTTQQNKTIEIHLNPMICCL